MGDYLQTWAGECSAWDCDGLGHMNMRHYMTKTRQARQMMIMRLGLDDIFSPRSHSAVRVTGFHIKYLGEARPDNPLRIETAITQIGETDIQLCHVMYHADNRLAATIVEWIDHIYLPTQAVFPWPARARAAADAFMCEPISPSKPRGFTYDLAPTAPNEETLKGWGLSPIGMGVFQENEMDLHGTAKPEACLGRVTETIGHYRDAWPEMYDADYVENAGSAALLEARIFINNPPRTGQAYHFYSGLADANAHTRSLIHNIVDPATGKNIFTMLGIGCLFNLKTRRLVKTEEPFLSHMRTQRVTGISV